MAQVLDLKGIPDIVLVRALRDRGYSVKEQVVDQMIRLNAEDVARIKGERTWSALVVKYYKSVLDRSDLEAIYKLAATPGNKPIKVALTGGPTKLILDLQKRWGTNLSETIRAFMYIVDKIENKLPEADR